MKLFFIKTDFLLLKFIAYNNRSVKILKIKGVKIQNPLKYLIIFSNRLGIVQRLIFLIMQSSFSSINSTIHSIVHYKNALFNGQVINNLKQNTGILLLDNG